MSSTVKKSGKTAETQEGAAFSDIAGDDISINGHSQQTHESHALDAAGNKHEPYVIHSEVQQKLDEEIEARPASDRIRGPENKATDQTARPGDNSAGQSQTGALTNKQPGKTAHESQNQ